MSAETDRFVICGRIKGAGLAPGRNFRARVLANAAVFRSGQMIRPVYPCRTGETQGLARVRAAAKLYRESGAALTESESRWRISRDWPSGAEGVLQRLSMTGLRISPEQFLAVGNYGASERAAT